MKKFFICFVCVLCTFACYGYKLHVDDQVIKLSKTKNTTPALHFLIHDERWYADMLACDIPMNDGGTTKKLKIRYGDTTYSVSDGNGYVFEDGKLVGTPCDVYLMGTGTQYIDTEYVPTLVTRSEMEIRFSNDTYSPNGSNIAFFGVSDFVNNANHAINFGGGVTQGNGVYPWLCIFPNSGCPSYGGIVISNKTTKFSIVLDAKNSLVKIDDYTRTVPATQNLGQYSIYLFGVHTIDKNGVETANVYSANDAMYIYSTKIYEDDVLIHDFLPVPAGLKIGNFTVPENGMWDIITQTFFGNAGTGDFIYGRQ